MRVVIVLEDAGTAANGHPAPAERRLARILKRLRRDYGFTLLAGPYPVPAVANDLLRARLAAALVAEGEREGAEHG